MSEVFRMQQRPAHLGLGGTVRALPVFDGTGEWYAAYEQDTAADGADGRLVSLHTFDESWSSWEMHPVGHEIVLCVAGEISLVQELDGAEVRTTLQAGEWVGNPPGVWHTADVDPGTTATCVFVTAGRGTQSRDRS
jgi:cupin superfamily acireductone dioxygenase involved in methionine salvage